MDASHFAWIDFVDRVREEDSTLLDVKGFDGTAARWNRGNLQTSRWKSHLLPSTHGRPGANFSGLCGRDP